MILAPRHLPRLAATIGLFTRYGLGDFARAQGLHRIPLETPAEPTEVDEGSAATLATAFRDRLVELGPAYIKLGQVLSTRPDLLPPESTAIHRVQRTLRRSRRVSGRMAARGARPRSRRRRSSRSRRRHRRRQMSTCGWDSSISE